MNECEYRGTTFIAIPEERLRRIESGLQTIERYVSKEKAYLTLQEAIARTGLSRSTFYRLFKLGKLTPHGGGSGRNVRINIEELDELMSSKKGAASERDYA